MVKARVGRVEWWVSRIGPIVCLALAGGCIWFARYSDRARGLPRDEEVRRLTTALESCPDPECAKASIEHCGTVRFPNGEWVNGVGIDSHSWKRAKDTLVVRDSRGRIRAFVGHVCGPEWMPRYFPENHPSFQSLKDFYAFLTEWGFTEYTPE
jgi:hypothetical protein